MINQVQEHLDKFTAIFVEEVRENLVGIYLHGSLAMGCFNPARSDIDLLVVVKEKMPVSSIKQVKSKILSLREEMTNGLEFSVIMESHLTHFVYPTPFEFHYSDFHREKYIADDNYLCGGYEDADLASQIAVAYQRGMTLHGQPLAERYPPIENRYYLASILHDIECASVDIITNPMYITLNLCRVLYFIKEGKITSKREGGEWGVDYLPSQYQNLVQNYLNEYIGCESQIVDQSQLSEFADMMLETIKQELT